DPVGEKAPATLTVAPLKPTLPAPLTLELTLRLTAPPSKFKPAPPATVKLPVSVPARCRLRLPLVMLAEPLLLNATCTPLWPVPLDFRKTPALLKVPLLPLSIILALFCRSQTAPLSLLMTAKLLTKRLGITVTVAELFRVRPSRMVVPEKVDEPCRLV